MQSCTSCSYLSVGGVSGCLVFWNRVALLLTLIMKHVGVLNVLLW